MRSAAATAAATSASETDGSTATASKESSSVSGALGSTSRSRSARVTSSRGSPRPAAAGVVEKPVSVTVAVALTGARVTPLCRASDLGADRGGIHDDERIDLGAVEQAPDAPGRPSDRVRLAAPDRPCQLDERGDVGAPAEGRVRDAEPGPVDLDDGRAGGVAGEPLLQAGRGLVARQAGDIHAGDGHAGIDPIRVLALVGEQGAGAEPEREHEPGDHAQDELPEREGAGGGGVAGAVMGRENLPAWRGWDAERVLRRDAR